MAETPVAVLGSGNIGTDLMMKVLRSDRLELVALVGVDPESDGLARARRHGVTALSGGVAELMAHERFAEVAIVFDATSARGHVANAAALRDTHVALVDLTPAALGPYVVPPVNLDLFPEARDVNLVTCGGQATVPVVAAVSSAATTRYAEIVSSIASRSAGPGTRAGIDEFTRTTARALRTVGGAGRGKAVIVLNPAEPPLVMRCTVLCVVDDCDPEPVRTAVHRMAARIREYVPGYRLRQDVRFRPLGDGETALLGDGVPRGPRSVVSVFLEIEGAGDYLPEYAGNLDIMTAAAVRTAERMAAR